MSTASCSKQPPLRWTCHPVPDQASSKVECAPSGACSLTFSPRSSRSRAANPVTADGLSRCFVW
jgi:hypothetical protein